jgi:cytochrome c-type biogenesis protein
MYGIEPLFFVSVFVAGILMFLAPCTLPLLPAYLGFVSGVTQTELRDGVSHLSRRRILKNAAFFVVGFTLIFALFGLLAGFAGSLLGQLREVLTIVGGVLIIFFGLFMLGTLRVSFLERERHLQLPKVFRVGTPGSSALLGAAFAFGWTPCIGPILATVLLYAGSLETIVTGVFALIVFAAGFSVPFLLLALLISQSSRFVERATPYLRAITLIGGIVLIILGLSLILGQTPLTAWFFRLFDHLDFEKLLLPYL